MSTGDQSQGGRAQDEILAGEYVLGVLSLEARRSVEQRLASDRHFADIVSRWQRDLASFNGDYEDLAPAPAIFRRIEQRLFGEVAQAAPPTGLWNSLAFWRLASLTFGATAVLAIVLNVGSLTSGHPARQLVADLASPNAQVDLKASYDMASGKMQIVPVAAGRNERKSLELWLVPSGGKAISLGILPSEDGGELVIPPDMRPRIGDGAIFAVTLEPFGGSPTGVATGPIVASGAARKL